MVIRSLKNSSIPQITDVFNLAFSDYEIPFQLTTEDVERKIRQEDLDMDISYGAFDNDNLVGFILHGKRLIDDKLTFYNAGTGVVPKARGQRLTRRIYDQAISDFKNAKYYQGILEVLVDNHTALKIYQDVGFTISRELVNLTGNLNIYPSSEYMVQETDYSNLLESPSNWEALPSWQNHIKSVENTNDQYLYLCVIQNETIAGYAIYQPLRKRIIRLHVQDEYRNQLIGSSILKYISDQYDSTINFSNIDANASNALGWVESKGFKRNIIQYEMKIQL